MSRDRPEVFLSYSGMDSFEADLLQFGVEQLLSDLRVKIWTYERDQKKSERQIAESLKLRIKKARAVIFLASPSTFNSAAAQWMELAYADAFEIPIYVMLHRLSFSDLKKIDKGVPPLLLEGQCNPAGKWREVVGELRRHLKRKMPERR